MEYVGFVFLEVEEVEEEPEGHKLRISFMTRHKHDRSDISRYQQKVYARTKVGIV